jgi:glycerol-3-phosphate acyltransferase PlsY
LGRKGYATVLAIDILKGCLVGGAARVFGIPCVWAYAAALLVVAGHVWPIWLGFRGGKGVGPFIGVWLVLAPLAILSCLVLGLVLLAFLRRVSLSGLCCLIILPAATWGATGSRVAVAAACATMSLLLWAHRVNIRGFVVGRLQGPPTPPPGETTNSK